MKLRSRSSRATGPKMRVPRGWLDRVLDVGDTRRRGAGIADARDHLDHAPALGRAVRAALLDAHEVALAHVTGLVVRRETLAHADDLLVERMLSEALDRHDDGLGLL